MKKLLIAVLLASMVVIPSSLALLTSREPRNGFISSPVTIEYFGDYQGPFDGRFWNQTYPLIKSEYIDTGKAKLIFRNFPLSFHPHSHIAAEAGECVFEQGQRKFWNFHNILFSRQSEWSGQEPEEVLNLLAQYASEAGADLENYITCMNEQRYLEEVDADFNEGVKRGVSGVPSFFINGNLLVGAQPFEVFQEVIESHDPVPAFSSERV